MLTALYQPVGGDYNLDQRVDVADYVTWRKAAAQSVDAYSRLTKSGRLDSNQRPFDPQTIQQKCKVMRKCRQISHFRST